MNRRPGELTLVAVALVCVLILAACNCAPTLRYITITPSGPTIVPGASEAFTATGYYSNGSITPNITVSWSSSNTAVAAINGTSGVATGVATGTTTITATALGITSTTTTLTVAPLTAITVTPATATISLTGSGNTQQYDAVGTYTTSTGTGTIDVTIFATWAATNSSIATFSTATPGLATAAAVGTTPITATLDGITGSASLTVTAGTSLIVTPANASLAVGNAVALTVVEQTPTSTQPVTTPVTWSSSTPAQANVVVQPGTTNNSGASVAAFASSGSSTVTITATEGTLTGSTTITVDQGTAQYAYVANAGSTVSIGSYTVTASAAPYLAPLATTSVSHSASQVAIDPNLQYLFLTSTTSGNTYVTPYSIASSGSLTAGTAVTVSNTEDSTYSLVDPYGRFLFIADKSTPAPTGNGGIYVYSISQSTGALTLVSGSPFTANLNYVFGLAEDQSGSYLYGSNIGPSGTPGTTLAGFSINPSTGALTPLSTPTFTNSLDGPAYLAWDPTGTYLYVANNGAAGGSVSSFTLGSNGILSPLTTTPITTSQALLNVAVSPNGSYLYVVDGVGNQLYGFTLTSGTPSSTQISGSPYALGTSPTGIAIDPTSSLLAVDNSGSNNIFLFTIGSGGVLTADTPVSTSPGATPYFVTFYNTF